LLLNKRHINRQLCGAVTEEGKRGASEIGRSARGQVRLPSSVTLPPKLNEIQKSSIPNRLFNSNRHHRQCATFSSGEGFGAGGKLYGKTASFIVKFQNCKKTASFIVKFQNCKKNSLIHRKISKL
jgi:hypothetical protein